MSRDLPARVAAAQAAAARDREPCCVYCRATAGLEPWTEEHLPTGFACRDADACRLRFLALNRVPDTTGDLRGPQAPVLAPLPRRSGECPDCRRIQDLVWASCPCVTDREGT